MMKLTDHLRGERCASKILISQRETRIRSRTVRREIIIPIGSSYPNDGTILDRRLRLVCRRDRIRFARGTQLFSKVHHKSAQLTARQSPDATYRTRAATRRMQLARCACICTMYGILCVVVLAFFFLPRK